MKRTQFLTAFALVALTLQVQAAGTWVPLKNAPPVPIGHFLLLSDGTVMGEANPNSYGPGWYKLIPDAHGSYVNGTWTNLASMGFTRLDFGSLVLTNGKVLVAGGEYGTGKATAEIYDPVSNIWTTLTIPTSVLNPAATAATYNIPQGFLDSCAIVLSNGLVLIAPVGANAPGGTVIYNPATSAWSVGPNALGAAISQSEASWVQLADGSVLTVNINSTQAQRYIPASNTWLADANVPVSLYSIGGELGPALLLPNGKAIYFGGTSNTAIYTASGTASPGSWVAGANFPSNQGMPDAPGAVMVNGKILCATSRAPYTQNGTNYIYNTPTSFYEYDYLSNSFTQVGAPGGGSTLPDVLFTSLMVDLPDGTVLFGHRQNDFYIYVPDGVPMTNGKPTISSITGNANGSIHLTGKLFNGLSAGASYGDDEQMDSNFPLVRFTDTNGIIRYGRTFNWSGSGVMTGNATNSTDCIIPPGASTNDNVQVVANGFESGFNPIVENTNDLGPGSLRNLVKTLPAGSTITFAASLSGQKIALAAGELLLTNNLTIDATSLPGGINIDGLHTNRAFEVAGGTTVTMRGLTLTNCFVAGASGGAVLNFGVLTLDHCTLINNFADSSQSGGAIENVGTLTLTGCTLSGNTSGFAGAMRNDGTCVMVNCTVATNTAPAANGGAIDNVTGTLIVRQCTFFGNSTGGLGGAIDNYLGSVNVTNSIVAGNSAGAGSDLYNWASSTINAGGSNLVQSVGNAGTLNGAEFLNASAPLLLPLGYYGGTTRTMPPQTNSPALDGGVDAAAAGILTDQTGATRIAGPHVDIGAVEIPTSPVVFNTADSGYGSLRYGATYLSNNATLTFAAGLSGQTIRLTSGEISLNKNLTIDAGGLPGGIVVDGNNSSRAFNLSGNIVLKSLTISNANSAGFGGGVLTFGNLTVINCKLVNNHCTGTGGALAAAFGTLTASNTTISGNVCDNVSAVYVQDESARFIGCTISGNRGVSGDAIRLNASGTGSQIAAVNCTLAGNTATNGVASVLTIQGSAGLTARAFVTNCTIVSNVVTVAGQPGAIYLQPGGITSVALFNTIVARNTSGGVENDITGTADPVSADNFIGAGGGLSNGVNGNQVGTANPQVAALGNYGGPTQTMPPLASSPVIDAGGDSFVIGIATDQTGATRTAGPHVDIGAVELPVSPVIVNTADSGYGSLRYAAAYSTNNSTLTFAAGLSGQTISLTSGEIFVDRNLVINAAALPAGITLRGDSTNRVLEVGSGVTLALQALTITNGGSSAVFGGAIQNEGNLILNRCTLVGNRAFQGGAIENFTSCFITNSTVANNSTTGNGGAIDDNGGSTWLTHCTFVGNASGGAGGAVANYLGTLTLLDNILANNTGNGGDIYNFSQSTLLRTGPNIVTAYFSDPNGTNTGPAAITSQPLLLALRNYGGPTLTMVPAAGSPAINAGAATGLSIDQRGYARMSGGQVDLGSVEVQIASQQPVLQNVSLSGGSQGLQFNFASLAGGSFSVLATTNVAAPLNTWSNLGPALEAPLGSGQFHFSDPQASNYVDRFYRVRSP